MKLPWQITLSVITCSRLLVVGNEQRKKKKEKRQSGVEGKGENEYQPDHTRHLIDNKRGNLQSVDSTFKINQSEGMV